MLRSLTGLERYRVTAADGDVGTVSDFLLDDRANGTATPAGEPRYAWAVRYLIVETGGLLHRRRILVSPISIRDADAASRRFHLSLTIEKIRNSPSFDTDKPFSRARERAYFQYYQYPYYWDYSGLWGMGAVPGVLATPIDDEADLRDDRPTEPYVDPGVESSEPHLRSARDVLGYHVQANDGVAGRVDDFLVDDESYEVRAIVVNTSGVGFGHKVLLAPAEVTRTHWQERNLYVNASRHSIVDVVPYEAPAEVAVQEEPQGAVADDEAASATESDTRAAHGAVGAAGGALTGGILGSIAGPPGVAAGVILGGIAGAVTEVALEKGAAEDAAHEQELDAQLGVNGGDIGAKNLRHPPAKRGAYAGASVGAGGSGGEAPAEGPIPPSR